VRLVDRTLALAAETVEVANLSPSLQHPRTQQKEAELVAAVEEKASAALKAHD